MPKATYQNDHTSLYLAGSPIQDRRNHPILVQAGSYPRLTGVDGRYIGSFRRFPGFTKVLDIKDLIVDSAGDTDGVDEVWFFKYIRVLVAAGIDPDTDEVYTGAAERVFSGFVVAHPYDDGGTERGVLRFIYYDREDAAWKSQILLQEIGTGTDQRIHVETSASYPIVAAGSGIDVAAMGPFLYFTVNRETKTGNIDDPLGNYNDGDYRRRSVRVESTGSGVDDVQWLFTEFGPLRPPKTATESVSSTGGIIHQDQQLKTAMLVHSELKNTSGPLVNASVQVMGGSVDTWRARKRLLTAGWDDIDQLGVEDDMLRAKLRCYRNFDPYFFETVGADVSGLVGGTLFREQEVPITADDTAISDNEASYRVNGDPADAAFDIYFGETQDAVLATLSRLDPFEDDRANAPTRISLFLPYQGTLLRVGGMPQAAPPAVSIDRDSVLSWGSLRKYAPEECRIQDATPLGNEQDDVILGLAAAGDYAFAVGDTNIYRIHRNGSLIGINTLQTAEGGVSRWAMIGHGTSLYYVTPSGLSVVDGATGEWQIAAAFDRIILDDWSGTLGSVRMAVDNRLGAIIVLNTDSNKQEAYLLWTNTGMITHLEDVPFKWATAGTNPADAGFRRSFWVSSNGIVWTPNAERSGDLSMSYGGSGSYTWNFTALATSYVTHVDVTGDVDPAAVGALLYFLSGAFEGTSVTITSINDETPSAGQTRINFTPALADDPALGDRVSIAPVIFEVVGWPFQDPNIGVSPFMRKIITSLGHSLLLNSGETSAANPNRYLEHRVYRRGRISDGQQVAAVEEDMDEDPGKNYSNIQGGVAGPTLFPAWRQMASNLDFEMIAGIVHGKLTISESESDPGA